MRNEEKREVAASLLDELPVVEGGNDRLACPGRGDDEVAVAVWSSPASVDTV